MKMIYDLTNVTKSEMCHYQTKLKYKSCLNLGENIREGFNHGKPNRRVLKSLSHYCSDPNFIHFT